MTSGKLSVFLLTLAFTCLSGGETEFSDHQDLNAPLELLFAGDVMLAGSGASVLAQKGVAYAFDSTRSVLADADIVCVNLEAPLTRRGVPFEKKYTFRVQPAYAFAMAEQGIDVCTLANNHILDYGPQGLFDTMAALDSAGIGYCGAGRTIDEAQRGTVITVRGMRIGFLAFSLTYPEAFWAGKHRPGTCYPTEQRLKAAIESMRSRADYVAAVFHWGRELMTTPRGYQKRLARKSIDWGADLIVGHHPHIPQGIEIYKGKLIAYSLGNYVFGSYSNRVHDGLLLKVELQGNTIDRAFVLPMAINNNQVHMQPRLLKGMHKKKSIQSLNQISFDLNQSQKVLDVQGQVLLRKP